MAKNVNKGKYLDIKILMNSDFAQHMLKKHVHVFKYKYNIQQEMSYDTYAP